MLNYTGFRPRVKCDGYCIEQDKVTFTYKEVVNICIVYKMNLWSHTLGLDFTLPNEVMLTKNADFDK